MIFLRIALRVLVLVVVAPVTTQAVNPKVVAKGQKVYMEYCKTCHQVDGKGMPGIYPPLASSDYIRNTDKKKLIQEVVNGKHGKVVVNGKTYNGVMAPMPKKYSCDDISCVLTYVFTSFGNSKGEVTPAEVKKACPKR